MLCGSGHCQLASVVKVNLSSLLHLHCPSFLREGVEWVLTHGFLSPRTLFPSADEDSRVPHGKGVTGKQKAFGREKGWKLLCIWDQEG